jgi:enamine deaminase RidA (YjgF/YER057c/UK114 family)
LREIFGEIALKVQSQKESHMSQITSEVERRLANLGFALPTPAAPVANYVPSVRSGALLFVSGQLPFGADGALADAHIGRVGAEVDESVAKHAAALCAVNVLAQVRAQIGDLDRIEHCVRLGGFIRCAEDYTRLALVMNGASDLVGAALGDRGAHARSTIGVAQLPLGACVEVEAIFEIVP